MNVYTEISVDGYEKIVQCQNENVGLNAFIAVHNTQLGPALGGCRMWDYKNEQAALKDVLRLSKGMTKKSALAGLPLGGGKSVIWGDSKTQKTNDLLSAMGDFVEHMGGKYIIAEDVGTSFDDMKIMRQRTKHVVSELGGDPGPNTALGVFVGIRAAASHRFGIPLLNYVSVVVQGVGSVGYALTKLLVEAGAQVTVSDISERAVARVVSDFGVKVVSDKNVYETNADIFAPCALGAIINEHTIDHMGASIIAGSANNQLATPEFGAKLLRRDKLYAPDFVINAGGVIQVAGDVGGNYDEELVVTKVNNIENTLLNIFRRSEDEGIPTNDVANQMVTEILGIEC